MVRHLMVAMLVCVGMTTAANAQRLFERLDKDKDGSLSKEEVNERMKRDFEKIDTNKDGKLVPQEIIGFLRQRQGANRQRGNQPAFDIESVEVQKDFAYAGTDNPRQRLDLYLPKERKSDKLPVVAYIHGGGWKNGDKSRGVSFLRRVLGDGNYAGVSIGYRLTDEAQWPEQIYDCKAAIRWIRAHADEYELDADRIAVWGTSAGGHLVCALGTSGDVSELEGELGEHLDQSSRVNCVVNFYGPTDFLTMGRDTANTAEALLLGGAVPEVPDVAKAASPLTYVSKDDPPFLHMHGTKDPLVPYAQAVTLHEALVNAGAPSILVKVEGGGHGFREQEVYDRVNRFLEKELLGKDVEVSPEPIKVR
ncbi:alpha/beta hydrolase fold domain-containing protein [Calycomorphotria hydatis]|uniref:Carboxylesterase NlhH n=1 Tax=Calycomorphotria hydatis TaxID=2528027 RepID=A0A517T602_9PLAN|nr:alpha/beta hydrolase fold domain-containing protein [Calycomorphotria hydatis]QDT63794.1 Carboxylesterase NlhH [Calycomorphotria hydatis]